MEIAILAMSDTVSENAGSACPSSRRRMAPKIAAHPGKRRQAGKSDTAFSQP